MSHAFDSNEIQIKEGTSSVFGIKKNTSAGQNYQFLRMMTDNQGVVEVKVPTELCSPGVAYPTKGDVLFCFNDAFIIIIMLPSCKQGSL